MSDLPKGFTEGPAGEATEEMAAYMRENSPVLTLRMWVVPKAGNNPEEGDGFGILAECGWTTTEGKPFEPADIGSDPKLPTLVEAHALAEHGTYVLRNVTIAMAMLRAAKFIGGLVPPAEKGN